MSMSLSIEPTKTMHIGCLKDRTPILWPTMTQPHCIQRAVSITNSTNHCLPPAKPAARKGKGKGRGKKPTTKSRPNIQNPIPPSFSFPLLPSPFFSQINLPPAKPAAGWNCVVIDFLFHCFFRTYRYALWHGILVCFDFR